MYKRQGFCWTGYGR